MVKCKLISRNTIPVIKIGIIHTMDHKMCKVLHVSGLLFIQSHMVTLPTFIDLYIYLTGNPCCSTNFSATNCKVIFVFIVQDFYHAECFFVKQNVNRTFICIKIVYIVCFSYFKMCTDLDSFLFLHPQIHPFAMICLKVQ